MIKTSKMSTSGHLATVEVLRNLINGGHAHATFENAVANIPSSSRNTIPARLPYSIWQLVEHIRITQWDILEFCRNPDYQPLTWPDDYWPDSNVPVKEAKWTSSIQQFKKDRKEFVGMLEDPANDLFIPFSHGEGQNLIREALLMADHTAYHVGQIIVIRRLLEIW